MNKYKVCVYAICKNEEKNIDAWVSSMNEADEIYVLDTGSTDNSVKLLKKLGVHVTKKVVKPWRFDVARNKSLELLPKDVDICVCTDIDERFDKGWRSILEKCWNKTINRVSYNYNWSFDSLGNPATNFYISKIHSRNGYTWINAVHEVLKYNLDNEIEIINDNITLNHYQDFKKERTSYLPLLELSVKEDPNNDRNMHYLGREYMYHKEWNKSIDTLIKHLNLKTSLWKDERSASMRYISRCYSALKRYDEAEFWLKRAIDESPYLREPYFEMGYLKYSQNKYMESKEYLLKCLEIKNKSKTYLNEYFSWDGSIEDMLSICEFNLKNFKEALKYAAKAAKLKQNEKRIKENVKIMKKFVS